MKVRHFSYGRYHGKGTVGSTRLRVNQLMKYWPEYQEYTYGEKPDVMVFQKVYMQPDWQWPARLDCTKILDICDPDWLDQQHVKQTVDHMDGVTCPTEALAEFLRQLTDKPVRVIPDRHELEGIPKLKKHKGKAKNAVWFGYSQNAELLKHVVPVLERHGISLTIISNENPYVNRWATNAETWPNHYKKFDDQTLLEDLSQFDICIIPQGNRPQDRFKSNNRTVIAWLAGLPVVSDVDDLEAMDSAEARNKEAKARYNEAIRDYDVKLSVKEMQEFIHELQQNHSPIDKT